MANCNVPLYIPFSGRRLATGATNPFGKFQFEFIFPASLRLDAESYSEECSYTMLLYNVIYKSSMR